MTRVPLLRAENVAVRYGHIDALRRTTIDIMPGSLTLILGPNGAGKTTFVKALAGAAPLHSGRVLLNGRDISDMPAYRRVGQGISLVPEGRGRLPGLSVRDNLILGWSAASSDRRAARDADIGATLELFPSLRERLESDCSTLSGGEMQMLAIARALLAKPLVLLLDEPSLGLAPIVVARVYQALAALHAGGLAMVLVEQKVVPALGPEETTLVMRNGEVAFQEERRPTPNELTRLYLGAGVAA